MTIEASRIAKTIFDASTPVIQIHQLGTRRWKRNVAKGSRIGPWLTAEYSIVNTSAWEDRTPCLYLISGSDRVIRYVGISRNRMKDRWRLSPALDAETGQPLAQRQLFHSQCWKHVERELISGIEKSYEVRCITGTSLISVIKEIGSPLNGFLALGNDFEGIVAGVERWLCNHRSNDLVTWNVAMTGQ